MNSLFLILLITLQNNPTISSYSQILSPMLLLLLFGPHPLLWLLFLKAKPNFSPSYLKYQLSSYWAVFTEPNVLRLLIRGEALLALPLPWPSQAFSAHLLWFGLQRSAPLAHHHRGLLLLIHALIPLHRLPCLLFSPHIQSILCARSPYPAFSSPIPSMLALLFQFLYSPYFSSSSFWFMCHWWS